MRYWAYFGGKLGVAAAPLYGLMLLIEKTFPSLPRPQDPTMAAWAALRGTRQALLCDLSLMLWFLLCAGALYLAIWDQRRRCRVCLRRLRMPIGTGSWGSMLQLGRPRIESICPYGHGTLTEEELQISGLANPEWKAHTGDMWDELCGSSKDSGKEP
jgi:hypothetical protein